MKNLFQSYGYKSNYSHARTFKELLKVRKLGKIEYHSQQVCSNTIKNEFLKKKNSQNIQKVLRTL